MIYPFQSYNTFESRGQKHAQPPPLHRNQKTRTVPNVRALFVLVMFGYVNTNERRMSGIEIVRRGKEPETWNGQG